ncbi:methyltransferase family protein [Bradyrhizobium cenepequi]|uniref:methyltransferase family protein n=1 Tax=Bradyrhizobium cenepequi TaxID=2821403 RepID=UPI001CE2D44B|nr:isoprenylcysteine carboxylmethyltransferase family protein [Bradyrhizobium cenepequi]MCA6108590.1 isoprenylcysteine carboxylmethyltransferase family protein [Bradyrhizobium cenepequi]
MAYLSACTDRIGFWTIDGDAVRWFGVAVCVAGSALRLIPVFVLKNRFSGLVAIQAEHKLETRGIYGLVRNPSYLGMLISAVGWALAFRSAVGVLLSLLLLIPLVPRIHSEERLLHEHFGKEYDDYFVRTWRLVP